MTSLRAAGQDGRDLMRHTYSYDNNGNQIAKMEHHQLTLYSYDRLNRLQEVDYGSGAQESYSYDPAGNRIRRLLDGHATSYAYDSRNRLLSLLEMTAAGPNSSTTARAICSSNVLATAPLLMLMTRSTGPPRSRCRTAAMSATNTTRKGCAAAYARTA